MDNDEFELLLRSVEGGEIDSSNTSDHHDAPAVLATEQCHSHVDNAETAASHTAVPIHSKIKQDMPIIRFSNTNPKSSTALLIRLVNLSMMSSFMLRSTQHRDVRIVWSSLESSFLSRQSKAVAGKHCINAATR